MLPTHATDEYPTRYAALSRPGLVAVLTPDADGTVRWARGRRIPLTSLAEGGRELAVVHLPMPNQAWTHLTDGIWGEARRKHNRPDAPVFVDVHATAPTTSRSQRAWTDTLDDFDTALERLQELVAAAREWVAARLRSEVAIRLGDGTRLWLERAGEAWAVHQGIGRRLGLWTAAAGLQPMGHLPGDRALYIAASIAAAMAAFRTPLFAA